MNKNLTFLLLVIFLISCSTKNETENYNIENKEVISTIEQTSALSENMKVETIQMDSLVFDWTKDLLGQQFSELNYKSEKRPIKNKYQADVIDTLETITFENSFIQIYHASDKDILVCAILRNSVIQLTGGLRISQDKHNVEKILNKRFNQDTLLVNDLEGNTNFKLIFSNDSLFEISYSGYLE